jgi:hypothetical protein
MLRSVAATATAAAAAVSGPYMPHCIVVLLICVYRYSIDGEGDAPQP